MGSYGYSYGRGASSGMLTVIGIISLAVGVLMIIAQWKLFEKAGEKGWKSLIPFYNGYLWYKLTWSAGAYAAIIILSIVSAFVSGVPVLGILLAITMVILGIMSSHMVSVSYGKGGGFTVGLVLLAPIFYMILAFGDSEYIGPMGVPVSRGSQSEATEGHSLTTQGKANVSVNSNLIWIGTGIFFAVTVLFFAAEALLSMKNYRVTRGLFESPFVGLQNYERLLLGQDYIRPFFNSLLYGLSVSVLAFLAGLAGLFLGRSGSAGRHMSITLGLLLAAVPRLFWESIVNLPGAVAFADILCGSMPWFGLALAAGSLLANRSGGMKPALLLPVLCLMSVFSGQEGVINIIFNPLNRGSMRMDQYLYRVGLQSGKYSLSASGYVLYGLICLLFAAIGCALLCFLLRGKEDNLTLERVSFSGAVSGILAALLLAGIGAWLTFGGQPLLDGSRIAQVLSNTILEMLIAILLGFGLYLLVLVLGGQRGSSGGAFPQAAFAFAVLSLGQMWFTKYLLVRNVGLVNTVVPVALGWLLSPRALALAVVLAMARPASTGERLRFAAVAALMAVVLGLGELRSSTTYLLGGIDLSNLLYRAFQSNEAQIPGFDPSSLWGTLLLFLALPLGAAITLMGLSSVRKENSSAPGTVDYFT